MNHKKKISERTLAVCLACCLIFDLSITVMAASGGSTPIANPLNQILTIATDMVTGIGAIVTLLGFFEFGNAQQTNDGSAKTYALQRISGGAFMILAPQLLQMVL